MLHDVLYNHYKGNVLTEYDETTNSFGEVDEVLCNMTPAPPPENFKTFFF